MPVTLLGRLQQRRTDDTEFDQALSRMILSPIITGYFYIVFLAGKVDLGGNSSWLFTTALFAHLSAFALLLHIYRFPGHYLLRRTIAMAQDFSCIGILLAVGGEAMLPAFFILFRTTVGYGIRYGGRFIFLSPLLGQATLGIVILSSDYWYNNAYLSVAFILTLFFGPVYAFVLTAKLQEARRLARC